jgi:hypothetical protein
MIELLTDKIIYGPLVMVPSIILLVVGLFVTLWPHSLFYRILGILITIIGGAGITVCLQSAFEIPPKESCPVTRVEIFPVEFRSENNTLYVFKRSSYVKVNSLTTEFVSPDDTLFIYHYVTMGRQLDWGEDSYKTFKRNQDAILMDSLILNPKAIELRNDTTLLDIDPDGGFIIKPDTLK